jgi:hypothetical protein
MGTIATELVQDQLIILYQNAGEDMKKGDVSVPFEWMAVQDLTYDNMIILAKDGGGVFIMHTPYEGIMFFIPTRNDKPIIAEKTLFGKYKFPKGKVAK